MVGFDEFFEFVDDTVAIEFNPAASDIEKWGNQTVHPGVLNDQLDKFFATPWPNRFALLPNSDGAIRLPPTDVHAEVVVHHQRGGGNQSHHLLKQITVKEELVHWLQEQIAELPEDYVAVHIRATDYTTDTKQFFRRIRRKLMGRPVVVSSDNPVVLEEARNALPQSHVIGLPGQSFISPGSPLHEPHQYSSMDDKVSAAKYLLRDVAVMASAHTFFYTFIDQPGKFGEARVSGLSRLVSFLVVNPVVRYQLLGFGDRNKKQKSVLVGSLGKKIMASKKLAGKTRAFETTSSNNT
jgi:hypothetical protein